MANVSYWFGSWTSAGPNDDLGPGQAHSWIAWGFNYGDVIAITAHPVMGVDEYILAVENVQIEANAAGRRIFFTVRNAGANFVPGYGMGFGYISA